MNKKSYSATPEANPLMMRFTLGTLEHAILFDKKLSDYEKQYALRRLQYDTRNAPPSTPLKSVLPSLGSGVLGAMIARFLGVGALGIGLATFAGYSLGELIADFYLNRTPGSKSNIREVR